MELEVLVDRLTEIVDELRVHAVCSPLDDIVVENVRNLNDIVEELSEDL